MRTANIRTLLPAASALAITLLATGCDRRMDLYLGNEIADRAAIGAIIRDTQEANNAGDVDAWLSLFDQDFRYLGPSAPAIADRDSLRALATAGFSRWRSEIVIHPEDIAIFDDIALVHSTVRGLAIGRTIADTVAVDLKQLVVYRRTNRGWRIFRIAINSNS